MGSQTAQENSLFLYDTLLLTDCSENSTINIAPTSKFNRRNTSSTINQNDQIQHSYFYPKLFEEKSQEKDATNGNSKDPVINNSSAYENDKTFSSKMFVLPTDEEEHSGHTPLSEISICRTYLNTMSQIRLVQLANAGNTYAARKLADKTMKASSQNVLHPNIVSSSKDAARSV